MKWLPKLNPLRIFLAGLTTFADKPKKIVNNFYELFFENLKE